MVGEMVQVARDALWVMEHKPEALFRCGPHALQRILTHANASDQWLAEIVKNSASPPGGTPLAEVAALSARVGMNYQMARRVVATTEIPVPEVVHWRLEHCGVDHYGAVVKKEGTRYLLDDPTFQNGLLRIEEDVPKRHSGLPWIKAVLSARHSRFAPNAANHPLRRRHYLPPPFFGTRSATGR
jgi:hypothetical protein